MDASAQPLARLRGFALSDRAFRRLAIVNAVMLVAIVATGATVRLTGSGLGCEHWPGCAPHHFEPKSYHSYIEFGNRVFAFLTILVTLITWIAAHRGRNPLAYRPRRTPGRPAPPPRLRRHPLCNRYSLMSTPESCVFPVTIPRVGCK